MTIGQNIQLYRKKRGLSQKELAEKLHRSTGTIQQYELNKREPKFEIISEIADILGIETYKLYGDDTPDSTENAFSKVCECLEEAGFSIDPPDENDGLQQYSINSFNHGTICKMDKTDIIETIQPLIDKANDVRDEILIGYIRKEIIDKL